MSGPQPTDRKTLEARGSWRARKRVDVPFEPGRPPMPTWFDEPRQRAWEYACGQLESAGLLATCDLAHLTIYADCMATVEEATADIAENGRTFTTDTGYQALRPIVGVKKSALAMLVRVAQQLGLSPSARKSVTVIDDEPAADPKASKFGIVGVARRERK